MDIQTTWHSPFKPESEVGRGRHRDFVAERLQRQRRDEYHKVYTVPNMSARHPRTLSPTSSSVHNLLSVSIGEELLQMVVRDEEILNIDMVWDVVDWLCQATQLTRDRDLEMEAVALSSLGKLYDQVSCDNYDSDGQQLSRSVVIIMVVYIWARSYDQVRCDNYDSDGQQLSRSVLIIMVVYIWARSMTRLAMIIMLLMDSSSLGFLGQS